MKTNGNDSAFPLQKAEYLAEDGTLRPVIGLSKREIFASMAMQGLLANSWDSDAIQPLSTAPSEQIAQMAVQQADALIEKLNEGEEK